MEAAGGPWLVYLQGAFVVWQFLRSCAIATLLVRLPVWALWYRGRRGGRRRRVFLLNEVYEDLRQISHDALSFRPGDERNGVEIIAREGYWVKAKFGAHYLIAHQGQIAKIWTTNFEEDVFVVNKVDINDCLSVATKLAPRDALLKIAGTFKTAEIKSACVYAPALGPPTPSSLGYLLASLPLFLQARGRPLLSLYVTLALLALELLRAPLFKLFDAAFELASLAIKLHVFRNHASLYLFFSLFSERWAYGDKAKKCVYNGKDHGFLVHTVAVFQNKDDYDLTFGYGDYQSSYPTPEDQHFVINKRRIYAMPILPKMGSYCKVLCRVNSVVTGKPSARANLYKQPLF